MTRLARLAGAVLLVVVHALGFPPEAAAVTPPPLDESLLPAPATPMPPRRTERQEPCVAAAAATAASIGDRSGPVQPAVLQKLWELSKGAGQTVAVIDTGVTPHPRLTRLIPGGDYVSSGDGTEDCDGHGTLVAGIVAAAADPSTPVTGIAPDAAVLTIRQSTNKYAAVGARPGSGFGNVDTLAKAVRTAADLGATVINISSVACMPAESKLDDRPLGAALAYAVDVKDVVVVSAAGNVGSKSSCRQQNPAPDPARPGEPDWDRVTVSASPGWYDDYVLTVGSLDIGGQPSSFSLSGPWVDVAAPGEAVVSLNPSGSGLVDALPSPDGSQAVSGTSYAAPVVSAIAALVRARFPQLSARAVMRRIELSAHRPAAGWDPYVGNGAVDALAAVSDTPPPASAPVDSARTVTVPETTDAPTSAGRTTALLGVAACAAAVVIALALLGVPYARLYRSRDGQAGALAAQQRTGGQ